MCSKWAVTQAVAFLILCLTTCNENSSISLLEFGASVSKCYVMMHLLVPEVNLAQLLQIAEDTPEEPCYL